MVSHPGYLGNETVTLQEVALTPRRFTVSEMGSSSGKRERADRLLVRQGLAATRSQAQALLLAGRVYLGEERIDKAGTLVASEARLTVRTGPRFVSRGGLKLDAALSAFELDVAGLTAVDIGASTGGFTDCLLQRGARRVYAVDVGHGQLSPKLRSDPRVIVMERTNARHLEAASVGVPVDLVVVDASFISLEKLLDAIVRILDGRGLLLALIKPQFEVGQRVASRGQGVIRDEALRAQAIERVLDATAAKGFSIAGSIDSALKGPKGNLEHFVLARLDGGRL